MIQSSFHIYDASAGSGKTFTLVKEYLKILFASNFPDTYRNVLALTFTNKAVGEMKNRIIENLALFSNDDILEQPNSMFLVICNELSITPEQLHRKSKTILAHLMHNYASFEVSTIDKFTQRVIRTFARDLSLPQNFEVELDTDILLTKAVDNLIARAGSDQLLTRTLIEFALEKADDDKSWDISYDLNNIAPILIKENDLKYIKGLANKSLDDFNQFKQHIKQRHTHIKEQIVTKANAALDLIASKQLEHNSFMGRNGYLPSYFVKLAQTDLKVDFDKAWMSKLETHPLYPSKTDTVVASKIDALQPDLVHYFEATKDLLITFRFLQNVLTNITPLSVLAEISKELTDLKQEQNILLISEFNTIISNHIVEQPAPFIYERLGEKFKHYFIDEFQDTSILQWQNLIPLITNALSGENASAMLVGDAKQAIYRWRGGKAEQFIGLCNGENPFQIKEQVHPLPVNYRSARSVISFNNQFFKHLSSISFTNPLYQSLYASSDQEHYLANEGYVNLSFIDFSIDDQKDEMYAQRVYDTIIQCLGNGYKPGDICVLVRRKKEGTYIAKYLSDAQIDIVSSETLLINNSPEIKFIISFIEYLLDPSNLIQKINVLTFVGNDLLQLTSLHEFYTAHINKSTEDLFKLFNDLGFEVAHRGMTQNPLVEVVESIVHGFNLNRRSNAYLQFFLDFVLDYANKPGMSIDNFITHYHQKKDSLSIVSPESINAVRIMTIHKSKGLEFPVVIFPYADLDIYREKSPKIWMPLNEALFDGFSAAYLNYNKDLQHVDEQGAQLYHQRQSELELDNINLLYVALTRPIEQLHIISNKRVAKKGIENTRYYSGLLINYLKKIGLWNESQLEYSFGNSRKEWQSTDKNKNTVHQENLISTPKEKHNIKIVTNSGFLWDTKQQDAIEKGNLIHTIMAQIKTEQDIDATLDDFKNKGVISDLQFDELKMLILDIVSHPKLVDLFATENTIYNERDIVTPEGQLLRPDRIVLNQNNEAIILDYKTGNHYKSYEDQLNTYASALEKMNLKVNKKILVYIDSNLKIKEV